jgi:hypothetical protein
VAPYGGVNGGKRQSVGSFCESPVDVRSPESASMGCERKEPFEIVISQCKSPLPVVLWCGNGERCMLMCDHRRELLQLPQL